VSLTTDAVWVRCICGTGGTVLSLLQATGPSVADWGGVMSACCTAGPIVC